MTLAKISIQRPLMMIMVILAITMFGFVAWQKLPIDRMPDMDLPYISIQAIYPGAGPEEIEANVVKPIEEQISVISGIKHITSYCMENASYSVIQFNDGVNPDLASIEVKDKIDQILQDLPEELEKPIISKFDPNAKPIVMLAVTGTLDPVALRNYVELNLKDKFAQIKGVAKVEVTGGREREIVVSLDAQKLAAHNLTIFQIAPLLTLQNKSVPAGYVTGKNREYSVILDGEFTSLEDIANIQIPIHKSYGTQTIDYMIHLRDVATITDGYKDIRNSARYQGEEAVQISITKSGDANTVATAHDIVQLSQQLQESLPQGIKLHVVEDKSAFINNSVSDTYSNIVMGIILTALILFLFLLDWRTTIIAALTMPISLIIALIGMNALGFSLNMVSMMALTIAVGILVTNSIVVIENIVRHRNTGQEVHLAAQQGADEIFMSIFASTLTNLAVFIPIASTTGIIGSIFKELGLTIVFATLASLVLSFTLVPLMASKLLKRKKVDHTDTNQSHAIDRFLAAIDKRYESFLQTLLTNPLLQTILLVATVGLFLFSLLIIAPRLGSEFAPAIDEGFIDITVEMPSGTPLEVTQQTIDAIEERIQDIPELVAVSSAIGGSGTTAGVQYGKVKVQITKESDRELTINDIITAIRPKLADLPDAKISVIASDDMAMAASDIVLEVRGPNLDSLIAYAQQAQDIMKGVGGLTDFNSSWKGAKPEIRIIPDRERLEHYGLTADLAQSLTIQAVGGLLRYNITGNSEAIYRDNGEEYPIRIQLSPQSRATLLDIESMQILTPRGAVPLSSIATVEVSGGVSSIIRKNREKMIEVTANILEGSPGKKVAQISETLTAQLPLPPGYTFSFAGDQEMMEDSFGQLAIAALLAVALTLMLLIALLESIPMGIVIASTLPMGLIGVILGLYLTGNTLSLTSILSIVMLIGIVVNNAILLIDYAREQRAKEGLTPKEAIIKAGGTKLKPILMSNIAIIVSMAPMALALGAGGSFRAPFAITAIAGVVVSTLLTFFIVPILYVLTAPKHISKES